MVVEASVSARKPFSARNTPLFSSQQSGSSSQQKLPSLHCVTRGRVPPLSDSPEGSKKQEGY